MCHLLHGDGAFRPLVSDVGGLCHRGILGLGGDFASGHSEIRPTLALHSISNKHPDRGDHFLHMVSDKNSESDLKKKETTM